MISLHIFTRYAIYFRCTPLTGELLEANKHICFWNKFILEGSCDKILRMWAKKGKWNIFFLTNDISHQQCYHHSCHTERERWTLILSAKKIYLPVSLLLEKKRMMIRVIVCFCDTQKKDTWTTEVFWHLIPVCQCQYSILYGRCALKVEWQSKSKKMGNRKVNIFVNLSIIFFLPPSLTQRRDYTKKVNLKKEHFISK